MSDWSEMLDSDVLSLGMAADEARRAARGNNVVTYLRVYEPPFAGDSDSNAAETSVIPLAVPPAAAELRLYRLPSSFEAAVRQLRATTGAAAGRRVVAFSFADLLERGWCSGDALRTLVRAGLADVAELPADQVSDLNGAIESLLTAGASPERVTVSRPLGSERAELLHRVQVAFARYSTLRRFSPLPRVVPAERPTTGYDDVRMVALARLALQRHSIEVDWQLYGPKLAQVALTFGADHLDSVSASDDTSLGPRRGTIADLERNIRAGGFEPQEYRPASDDSRHVGPAR